MVNNGTKTLTTFRGAEVVSRVALDPALRPSALVSGNGRLFLSSGPHVFEIDPASGASREVADADSDIETLSSGGDLLWIATGSGTGRFLRVAASAQSGLAESAPLGFPVDAAGSVSGTTAIVCGVPADQHVRCVVAGS